MQSFSAHPIQPPDTLEETWSPLFVCISFRVENDMHATHSVCTTAGRRKWYQWQYVHLLGITTVFILCKLTCPQVTLICNFQPAYERSSRNLGIKLLPRGARWGSGRSTHSQGRGKCASVMSGWLSQWGRSAVATACWKKATHITDHVPSSLAQSKRELR